MTKQKRIFSPEHRQKLSAAKKGNKNAKKKGETVTEHSISLYFKHTVIARKLIKAGKGDNLSQVVRKALEWAETRF